MKWTYIFCTLVLVVMMIYTIPAGDSTNLHVGDGQTYSTIGQAISAASDNDHIVIHEGTYAETIDINNKDLYIHAYYNESSQEYDDVVVTGSNTGNDYGLEADSVYASFVEVWYITFNECAGIYCYGIDYVEIWYCDIYSSGTGITMCLVDEFAIDENWIVECHNDGISILYGGNDGSGAQENDITDNWIDDCQQWGIALNSMEGADIMVNKIFEGGTGTTYEGINIQSSDDVLIQDTDVYNNSGIGIEVTSSTCLNCEVETSNLRGNNGQAADGHGITWDRNYYSDYIGSDLNQDGYGDTAYIIPTSGSDSSPKMTHYSITPSRGAPQ